MTANSIVLASGNQGKIKELNQLLTPIGWQVHPQSEWHVEDVEETGLSFVENAILKARHACQQTGLPSLADDSGLAVDALDGAPGIYSARFAGVDASDTDNIAKLLDRLKDTPQSERSARFICVLVFMQHASDPTPIICQGEWEGHILTAPHGDGGFGYDPVFYVPERDCSAAQLSAGDKQLLSHRGKALSQLRRLL